MTEARPSKRVTRAAWKAGRAEAGQRAVPVEMAVALVYNGSTHAVMMASPADLEDFAIGFSLAEEVIAKPSDIETMEILPSAAGIEIRMWLNAERAAGYTQRRRLIAGPTGCGLCGIESLDAAMKQPPKVTSDWSLGAEAVSAALATLPAAQKLNAETRAVHAAGYWEPAAGLVALREDVGRHNALDKLAGALARQKISAARGLLLLTSRISVEMVQKAALMGAPVIVAVSAPTSLAIEMAEAAGLTLIAVARGQEFEVFAGAQRLAAGVDTDVA